MPGLLASSAAVTIACAISERRTRRALASISAAVSQADPAGRPAAPQRLSSKEDLDRLLADTEAALNGCRRIRWFAADLSHELRSPLTALCTELEEARLHPDHVDVPRLIDDGLSAIRRVEAVLTNMLTLAQLDRNQRPQRERFDLTALVREEVSAATGPHPVHLRPSGPVMVAGVRGQLRRAVANLLDNAQRHAYTRIEVEVGRTAPGIARLIVDDDGDGIPEPDRERLFLRARKLDSDRRGDEGGAGLSLAIARMVAEAHGGTLQIEDPPASLGGARFVLRLPTAEHSHPGA